MTQAAAPICLITRPEPEASDFARRLEEELGLTSVISPLLRYAYPRVSIQIDSFQGVILTSAAAVPVLHPLSVPRAMPIYAVGKKTAEAATNRGYAVKTGPGDAAGLVRMILDHGVVGPLVHLRGEHARGDIARTLSDNGCQTREFVVYQQLAAELTDTARLALEGKNPVILPLFSPRTAMILCAQGSISAPLTFIAMSRAVADACAEMPSAAIRVADSPDADAMVRAIKQAAAQYPSA